MDKFGCSGDYTKGELCVGCAQMILHSPLGKTSGSESRSLPGGESPTGFGLGACMCWGWRALAPLRNRAALWLFIASVCSPICLQLCQCSSFSLSCRHPLSRAKPFPHPHQHNAVSFSSVCDIPWLFLLPHLCSLICLQGVGADLSSPQLSGTAATALAVLGPYLGLVK